MFCKWALHKIQKAGNSHFAAAPGGFVNPPYRKPVTVKCNEYLFLKGRFTNRPASAAGGRHSESHCESGGQFMKYICQAVAGKCLDFNLPCKDPGFFRQLVA